MTTDVYAFMCFEPAEEPVTARIMFARRHGYMPAMVFTVCGRIQFVGPIEPSAPATALDTNSPGGRDSNSFPEEENGHVGGVATGSD